MKWLVIGSGGREHAICWKLAQSDKVDEVHCIPGNDGISLEKKSLIHKLENLDYSSKETTEYLIKYATKNKMDYTIVGPELPLVSGIVNEFRKAGMRIIGPDKDAAKLEGSKSFAKEFMKEFGVRTPASEMFEDYERAVEHVKQTEHYPVVIKADGLAGGKGVYVCENLKEALNAVDDCMKEAKFGRSGEKILIEDYLKGEEISVLTLTDTKSILPFISSRDHKRLMENDQGPNTGGMGVITPNPAMDKTVFKDFQENCLYPTLNGLRERALDYRGVLFFGLMVKDKKCYVLEYNVRMGDPETQSVLPLMKTDFAEALEKTESKQLDSLELKWHEKYSTTVVMASRNYPLKYKKGVLITMDDFPKNNGKVFYAGVARDEQSRMVTDGGRVLSVTSVKENRADSIKTVYEEVTGITFDGAFYRKDIGGKR